MGTTTETASVPEVKEASEPDPSKILNSVDKMNAKERADYLVEVNAKEKANYSQSIKAISQRMLDLEKTPDDQVDKVAVTQVTLCELQGEIALAR